MKNTRKLTYIISILLMIILVATSCTKFEVIKPEDEVEKDIESENSEDQGTGEETTSEPEVEEPEETTTVVEEPEVEEPIDVEQEVVNELFKTQFDQDEPYTLDVELSELSDESLGWSFDRKEDHAPVTSFSNLDLSLFGTYFINPTDEKVMYLTFDEGYENGYTATILDILMEFGVKATFFVTGHYIDSQPDLVIRMVEEGHIVANHSVKHPKFSTLTADEIYDELTGLATKFEDLTGTEMAPFFRPPSGDHSEKSLYLTRKLGYRSIFWSMAFHDWDPDDQPGKDGSYEHVMTNYHPGAIILLHAVSESNTEALPDILRDLIAEGYRFGSLYELE